MYNIRMNHNSINELFVVFNFIVFHLDLSLSDILSKIHALMMSYLTDSEYSSLVKEYKSDQFENEHSQLVRWLVLLRTFFHRQQTHHSHKPKKKNIKEKKGKKTQVLKTITGSFDNLHSKQV